MRNVANPNITTSPNSPQSVRHHGLGSQASAQSPLSPIHDTSLSGGSQHKRTHKVAGNKEETGGSKCSGTVSMRDESIMHMSVNSVTDERYYHRDAPDAQSYDSNDQASIKKQMIRYLSRVADRNKLLFVFN